MNLTIRINEIEYSKTCIQGVTFSEEYNETLDSGAIVISHINKIYNLKPYNDVYVYDSRYSKLAFSELKPGQTMDNGIASFDEQLSAWRAGGNNWDGIQYNVDGTYKSGQPFYRHLLVDSFTEQIINLDGDIYTYNIELMSETKGLEAIQLPNISITQPLNETKKVSIYEYLVRFVNLYSPKVKKVSDSTQHTWVYSQKYKIDDSVGEGSVRSIFEGLYSPDFSPSNPTLRDVLSQLMIVADCIPYVKDNVIYAKDITKRLGKYDIHEEQENHRINYITGTMSSDDYCDNVRRQYSGALSSDGKCNYVEHLGFRNSSDPIMTMDNMVVETSHPIYKINKMYMCYYTKVRCIESGKPNKYYYVLIKQNITPLVKLSSEWSLLNQDWTELQGNPPTNIYELSKYKLTTVNYSIGSNMITGWGCKYNEAIDSLITVYDITKSYIENIVSFVSKYYPYGIYNEDIVKAQLGVSADAELVVAPDGYIEDLFCPEQMREKTTILGSNIIATKALTFEIDYVGFFSGALIHTRDIGDDNITHNDNASASLSLLEKDGINQKEKLNRFANKNYLLKGRCNSMDEVLKLGHTIDLSERYNGEEEYKPEVDDIIIYRRQYSMYNNEIICSYAGIQDYVLKNYFTSVYAKYRTYQLMSYGESVERAENRKLIYLLSKNAQYNDSGISFDIPSDLLFSAFNEQNNIDELDTGAELDNINTGYIEIGPEKKQYAVDEYTFTSGNSLCFNVAMTDNASGGNYIKKWGSKYESLAKKYFSFTEDIEITGQRDYITGSVQNWYDVVDDDETGAIKNMGLYVCHSSEIKLKTSGEEKTINGLYDYFAQLPQISENNFSLSDAGVFSYNTLVGKKHKLYVNYSKLIKGLVGSGNEIKATRVNVNTKISLYNDNEHLVVSSSGLRARAMRGAVAAELNIICDDISQTEGTGSGIISPSTSNTIILTDTCYDKSSPLTSLCEVNLYDDTARETYGDISAANVKAFIDGMFVQPDYLYERVIDILTGDVWAYQAEEESYAISSDDVYIYCDLNPINDLSEGNSIIYQPSPVTKYISRYNTFGVTEDLYKDNKEVINMTYQVEPLTDDKNNIVFGEWLARLSNLVTANTKNSTYEETSIPISIVRYTSSLNFGPAVGYDDPSNIYYHGYFFLGKVHDEDSDEDKEWVEILPNINDKVDVHLNMEKRVDTQFLWYHGYSVFRYSATAAERISSNEIKIYGAGRVVSSTFFGKEWTRNIGDIVINLDTNKSEEDVNVGEVQNPPAGETISSTMTIIENASANVGIQRNMFLEYSGEKINAAYSYAEHSYNSQFKEDLYNNIMNEYVVSDIISVKNQDNQEYIDVDLSHISQPGSLRFWYFDDKNAYERDYDEDAEYLYKYSPDKSGFKFVFGVNITEDDIENGHIKIYISKMYQRDKRVYDENMRLVGYIHNNKDDYVDGNSYDAIV